MAIKQLQKTIKPTVKVEEEIEKFISQGGSVACSTTEQKDDHRLTLRIPLWLMDKIDTKRKERIGTISRNLWILETLDKATRK